MSQQFRNPNRRQVIKAAGAAVAASSVGYWSSLAAAQSKSPNEKLNIACIGTANQATFSIDNVKHENIAVLCDVDSNYLNKAAEQFKSARLYRDYREMIDKEADKIDAVVVAIADHHHAPATVRALKAGKHVYCEKPLTHTVGEARLVAKLAKEKGVATQMGTQIHAGENYRKVVEIIQSGAIGDVNEVHVWSARLGAAAICQPKRIKLQRISIGTSGWVQHPSDHLPRAATIQPVASMVAVRIRHTRRHGLPLYGSSLLGFGTDASHGRRSRRDHRSTRKPVRRFDRALRVPSSRQEASREDDLVRWQYDS